MNESDFALEMKHSIDRQLRNIHYNKIPDQVFNPNARFNPEKDYDAYITYKGCFTAMEYKLHKTSNAFPLSKVTLIQRSALLEARESGCHAYVIICVRYGNVRRTFFIMIEEFLSYCKTNDRKSMPINDMENYPEIKWLGKGYWELNDDLFTY